MKRMIALSILSIFLLNSCGNENLPKPKGFLRLDYPEASYNKIQGNCPFTFEVSSLAHVEVADNCWMKIRYPKQKATIHITYRPVQNNLNEILKEVEKLTYEHTLKADGIEVVDPYENVKEKVFGQVYNIEGSVASNLQFRVTDSLKHVVSGSLYFYAAPNYDSIAPAINYLEKDLRHLIESFRWKSTE